MQVTASGQACGASVTGVNLSRQLDEGTIHAIRAAWLEHHVLAFPDQQLDDADLERIIQYFGVFGREPYFVPIEAGGHVVALTRRADEQAPVFAESWHSDWSFLAEPPIGTCLYSLTIPPVGGDTGFINQQKVLADMPASLRSRLEGLTAYHSAAAAYAPEGLYGEQEEGNDRSMKILYSDEARDVQTHPLIVKHPESGCESIFGCAGYIVGFEGLSQEDSNDLLMSLYEWQTREEFQYTHRWREGMFVMWDNRSVLHRANGGYDGYARELHRITIAGDPGLYLAA
jgi:taurine dioxygenase